MKNFIVTVDVTLSGDIYVQAESEQEARKKIASRNFTHSDLRHFHYVGRDIVECEETDEV